MIIMQCPHCKDSLRIPDHYADQSGSCKKCGKPITVCTATDKETGPKSVSRHVVCIAGLERHVNYILSQVALANGYETSCRISKTTTHGVCNLSPGEAEKALAYGVEMLTPEQFMRSCPITRNSEPVAVDHYTPATSAQIEYLKKLGAPQHLLMGATKLQAMAWLDFLVQNVAEPATELQRMTLDIDESTPLTKAQASILIGKRQKPSCEIIEHLWNHGLSADEILSFKNNFDAEQRLKELTGKTDVPIPIEIRQLATPQQQLRQAPDWATAVTNLGKGMTSCGCLLLMSPVIIFALLIVYAMIASIFK